MKNNNEKKRKRVVAVAIAVVLAVVIGSGIAIGVFRTSKGSTKRSVFTDKLTETTTLAKATTEKTTKAAKATTEKSAKAEKAKASSTKTEGGVKKSKNDSTKATTEAPTEASQPVTEAPYVPDTEAPYVPDTEAPTTATTQAPATTERATQAPTEAPTTQHQHSWEAITETTTEKVKVKDAWDEEVEYYKCSYCGARETEVGQFHITDCGEKYYNEDFHKWLYEGASWVSDWDTVHHDAVYKDKEVTKTVGYKCTTCGATK